MYIQRFHTKVEGKRMDNNGLLKIAYKSIWNIKHIRNGEVIWEDTGKNSLAQQGQEATLELMFRGTSAYAPAQYYVRLCNEDLVISSTLATVSTEPAGTYGYAAQLLERSTTGFPTKSLISGVYTLTTKVLTFTASGGSIGPVKTAYLATTSDNSGSLIAYRGLSMARTVLNGDSMTLQFAIDLS